MTKFRWRPVVNVALPGDSLLPKDQQARSMLTRRRVQLDDVVLQAALAAATGVPSEPDGPAEVDGVAVAGFRSST